MSASVMSPYMFWSYTWPSSGDVPCAMLLSALLLRHNFTWVCGRISVLLSCIPLCCRSCCVHNTNSDAPLQVHARLHLPIPLHPPFNNIELQNHDRETQNRTSCFQATPYNTRTNAVTLDVYQSDPENTSPVIANAANSTSGSTH